MNGACASSHLPYHMLCLMPVSEVTCSMHMVMLCYHGTFIEIYLNNSVRLHTFELPILPWVIRIAPDLNATMQWCWYSDAVLANHPSSSWEHGIRRMWLHCGEPIYHHLIPQGFPMVPLHWATVLPLLHQRKPLLHRSKLLLADWLTGAAREMGQWQERSGVHREDPPVIAVIVRWWRDS